MNKLVPIGLSGAAVVVAIVIGSRLLAPPLSGVGGPPSMQPSASPSASPSPSPSPSRTPVGQLPEGPFVLNDPDRAWGGPGLTVMIPAPGWINEGGDDGGLLVRANGGDPPNGAAIIGPFHGEFYVYEDPCQWEETVPDAPATTVDDLVAALAAQPSRDASAPEDITVDGYEGKRITLHVPDDLVESQCDDGHYGSWGGGGEPLSNGPSRYHQGPGQIDELWILDIDGALVVIDAMYGAETSDQHVDEMHAILESMDFGTP